MFHSAPTHPLDRYQCTQGVNDLVIKIATAFACIACHTYIQFEHLAYPLFHVPVLLTIARLALSYPTMHALLCCYPPLSYLATCINY